MTKNTYRLLQKAKAYIEELDRQDYTNHKLTDTEREAISIVAEAIAYDLSHIPPEEYDGELVPTILTDTDEKRALCEAIERLQELDIPEQDRVSYIALVKQCYGVGVAG